MSVGGLMMPCFCFLARNREIEGMEDGSMFDRQKEYGSRFGF